GREVLLLVGDIYAIAPEATGPTAKPKLSAMPAHTAPWAPRKALAHAVPTLIVRPTPSPTTKRPINKPPVVCHAKSIEFPNVANNDPNSIMGRLLNRSASKPPSSRHGNRPTA